MMMYKSLVSTGQKALATGPLVDAIRRVGCFGVCLAPLDLRQVGTAVGCSFVFYTRRCVVSVCIIYLAIYSYV